MTSTSVSKIRILAGLSVALMVLSFITAHSWFFQIITLSLGASALITVFTRLCQARRTGAGNQPPWLPWLAIAAAAGFIFRFFIIWATSRPARYADYMPEGEAPITNGIALNNQFFQVLSMGLIVLLPVVFFVLLMVISRGKNSMSQLNTAN